MSIILASGILGPLASIVQTNSPINSIILSNSSNKGSTVTSSSNATSSGNTTPISNTSYTEGNTTYYKDSQGNIYKGGIGDRYKVDQKDYKYIPSVIGGTRENKNSSSNEIASNSSSNKSSNVFSSSSSVVSTIKGAITGIMQGKSTYVNDILQATKVTAASSAKTVITVSNVVKAAALSNSTPTSNITPSINANYKEGNITYYKDSQGNIYKGGIGDRYKVDQKDYKYIPSVIGGTRNDKIDKTSTSTIPNKSAAIQASIRNVLEFKDGGKNGTAKGREDVALLQKSLEILGYLDTEGNYGYFGEKTLEAVNQYKKDKKLDNQGENYGKIGVTTLTQIQKDIINKSNEKPTTTISNNANTIKVGNNGVPIDIYNNSEALKYSTLKPTANNGVPKDLYNKLEALKYSNTPVIKSPKDAEKYVEQPITIKTSQKPKSLEEIAKDMGYDYGTASIDGSVSSVALYGKNTSGMFSVGYETGVNKTSGKYEYGGWDVSLVKAEASAGIGASAKVALVEGKGSIKIPVPFTDSNFVIGVTGDLGSLGAEFQLKNDKFKFGAHFIAGASAELGFQAKDDSTVKQTVKPVKPIKIPFK